MRLALILQPRRFLLVILLGAVGPLLSVAAAGADTRTAVDPANAQQADPVGVSHGHVARRRGILFYRLATRQPWVGSALGNVTVSLWVNRRARGRPDRTIVAELNEVETLPFPPTSWMGVVRDRRDRFLGHANTWQPSLRSFRIEFAKRLLGARVRYYRWALVVTSGCESASPPALCGPPRRDRVPDRGSMIHRRP